MSIKIIKEPDLQLTEAELNRYRQEYQKAMMFRVGPYPTLEEWIRGRKKMGRAAKEHKP